MKIGVIGTGGVGGYYGGRLAQAGYNVTFVARGKHKAAIQKKGLKIISSSLGDYTVKPVNVTEDLGELSDCDLIMICVKAWQVKEIAASLVHIIKDDCIILPLQNGVLASEELCEILPKKHVLGGLCKLLSKIEAPGVIKHFGFKPTIVMGELNNNKTDRILKIHETLTKAGINSIVSEDIEAELWKKFILICVSALLALTRTTMGELRTYHETRQLMVDLLTEICNLARHKNINIPDNYLEQALAVIDAYPANSNNSLTRDILSGKPSELEYQNGSVVKLAEKSGFEAPINRFVYHCLLPMELKARETLS